MGLFEKKFCDLCGEKVNLLTRQKLQDGFLCSDCKHKLSCLSDDWDDRSISDVKAHIEAREANKAKYAQFSATAKAGRANELMVDAAHGQFCFAIGKDFSSGNPEVFEFSQLQNFWIEEIVSMDNTDSDGDGIPDSRDSFNNRSGMPQANGNMFGGMFNGMIGGMMAAPMNLQQYIRRTDDSIISTSNSVKYISSVKAHFSINHPYIKEVDFYIDSSISRNSSNELMQAYNIAAQIVQLCEQIKGASQQTQQQYQQPMQQGFAQQQYQQPMQQGFAQQQYQQQPMQQGFAQQQFQQQPVQQATVMPFCPGCGAQNTSGAAFCPNCGNSLKK